jgi:hypothetical protein
MRSVIILAGCILLMASGYAQHPIRFRSTEWLGLSSGQAGSAVEIQTVNGVAAGPWFLGAGAGIDYYRFRSVPLFVSATRDLTLSKKDGLLLFFDWGTNVPWYTVPAGDQYWGSTTIKFHSGYYLNTGIGYLFKLDERGRRAVILSAGYSEKKISEVVTDVPQMCPIEGVCDIQQKTALAYLNRMFRFMVGFRF